MPSKNFGVIDTKTKNFGVIDTKSKMDSATNETVTYNENKTIRVGESMGLLLTLTYPTTTTFIGPRL